MKDRISYVIQKLGIKKTDFAKALCVSQSMVSLLCSGAAKPSYRTISDICRIFHVNEVWLRTGVGEPFIQPEETEEQKILRLLSKAPPAVRLAIITLLESCVEGGEKV